MSIGGNPDLCFSKGTSGGLGPVDRLFGANDESTDLAFTRADSHGRIHTGGFTRADSHGEDLGGGHLAGVVTAENMKWDLKEVGREWGHNGRSGGSASYHELVRSTLPRSVRLSRGQRRQSTT